MDNVERARDLPEGHFAVKEHVEVQHEDLLFVDLTGAVVDFSQKPGTALDVCLRAAGHCDGHQLLAFDEHLPPRVFVCHQPQITRRNQLMPRRLGKPQRSFVDRVHVPKPNARKIRGLIDFDERGKHNVQPLGKLLPAGVARGGQGDEALCQTDLPAAVGGNELVIVDRPLLDHLPARVLGRQLLNAFGILGIDLPDGVLEIGRLMRLDFQNIGKPQLADDLNERTAAVEFSRLIGKHPHLSLSCAGLTGRTSAARFVSIIFSIPFFDKNASRLLIPFGAKLCYTGDNQAAQRRLLWDF